jgi:hypothetical protein
LNVDVDINQRSLSQLQDRFACGLTTFSFSREQFGVLLSHSVSFAGDRRLSTTS